MRNNKEATVSNKTAKTVRSPLANAPLTPAERKRRSRTMQAERGGVTLTMQLRQPLVATLDETAIRWGSTRTDVLTALIEGAVRNLRRVEKEAGELIAGGFPAEEVYALAEAQLALNPEGPLSPTVLRTLAAKLRRDAA